MGINVSNTPRTRGRQIGFLVGDAEGINVGDAEGILVGVSVGT